MALSMDEPFIFFENVPDAAGNQRQLQTTKLKFMDASGRLCTLGMSQDVTDIVRIQREIATTKEAYEKARSTGIIFTNIAQTLVRGYTDLYYVNLDTEEYTEYVTDDNGKLVEAKHGQHFFEQCKTDIGQYVYPEDREMFLKAMDRRTFLDALDRNSTFMITYRLLGEQEPTYVSLKASRMQDDARFAIIGVSDIDEQMKQRQAADRAQQEHIAYLRLHALTGDILCVYIVDPQTGQYREYRANEDYETVSLPNEGEDFFAAAQEQGVQNIYAEDRDRFLSSFTKESILAEIKHSGIFTLSCRLVIRNKPNHVKFKAAIVEEPEGARLIIGINNIDAQLRQGEDYARRLAQAQNKANIDALTGVKNMHAYIEAEKRLDRLIAEHHPAEFAIVVLDVNDLKTVNDSKGHQAGDQHLLSASAIICGIFKRSPVFRIGGDEFAVIAQGQDYRCIEELLGRLNDHNISAFRAGGVVIACGMARFDQDDRVASVFSRADQNMYENKRLLKAKNAP